MSYPIRTIEGVGPKYAEMLGKAGITNTKQLLQRAASRKGRKDLAGECGVDEKLILKWANMCDLMRIKGVGEEYSELLEAAGVDTVKELAKRKADSLHKAMAAANGKRGKGEMVRQLPALKQVESWVTQAKSLDPVMTY